MPGLTRWLGCGSGLMLLVLAHGCNPPPPTAAAQESLSPAASATVTLLSDTLIVSPSPTSAPTARPTRDALSASERQALRDLGLAKGFARFLALAASSGALAEILQAGPVTLLAPMDLAIEALPLDSQRILADDPAARRAFVLRHVLPGSFTAAELVQAGTVSNILGADLQIQQTPGGVLVGAASIVTSDIPTPIGRVQVLDRVLPKP